MTESTFTYRMTYASGKTHEETVHDCDTKEKFINHHFGSVDPDEYGVAIELIAIDGQTPPSDEPAVEQPKEPATEPTKAPSGKIAKPAPPKAK